MEKLKPSLEPGSAALDATLLARMTGRLGDRQTVESTANALAAALCEPLQEELARLAAMPVTVARAKIALGLRSELEHALDERSVRCPAAVKGWCDDVLIAADAPLAIAFAESLLGGGASETDNAAQRTPTKVELDVSIVLFEQVVSALKTSVGLAYAIATAGEPSVGGDVEDGEEGLRAHAALLTLDVTLGSVPALIQIILPQTTVTKSKVAVAKPAGTDAAERQPEWVEKLKEQVARSDVTLNARIRLAPLTLGELARLQPGDVVPFAAEQDPEVELDANGMHLYRCELGRSGNRYTVRLKAAPSLEADLVELLGV